MSADAGGRRLYSVGELAELYAQGASLRELAEAAGFSQSKVRRLVVLGGGTIRRQGAGNTEGLNDGHE